MPTELRRAILHPNLGDGMLRTTSRTLVADPAPGDRHVWYKTIAGSGTADVRAASPFLVSPRYLYCVNGSAGNTGKATMYLPAVKNGSTVYLRVYGFSGTGAGVVLLKGVKDSAATTLATATLSATSEAAAAYVEANATVGDVYDYLYVQLDPVNTSVALSVTDITVEEAVDLSTDIEVVPSEAYTSDLQLHRSGFLYQGQTTGLTGHAITLRLLHSAGSAVKDNIAEMLLKPQREEIRLVLDGTDNRYLPVRGNIATERVAWNLQRGAVDLIATSPFWLGTQRTREFLTASTAASKVDRIAVGGDVPAEPMIWYVVLAAASSAISVTTAIVGREKITWTPAADYGDDQIILIDVPRQTVERIAMSGPPDADPVTVVSDVTAASILPDIHAERGEVRTDANQTQLSYMVISAQPRFAFWEW